MTEQLNRLTARTAQPHGKAKVTEAQMLGFIDQYNEAELRNSTGRRWMLCGEEPNRFPKCFDADELRKIYAGQNIAA